MSRYLRVIHSAVNDGLPISVDVYSVLVAFAVTCPARQNAIEKLLCAGQRGKGSELQDLSDAYESISRSMDIVRLKGIVGE